MRISLFQSNILNILPSPADAKYFPKRIKGMRVHNFCDSKPHAVVDNKFSSNAY